MEMSDNLDLEGRVRREPYKMVAAAAGVGFILAGGLVSPLTARVLGLGMRIGLRVVAVPLLQAALMGALWNRIQSDEDAESTQSRRKAQPRAETQESQQEKNHERTSTKRS
jgi:H+/Cl- antiporter ClcA